MRINAIKCDKKINLAQKVSNFIEKSEKTQEILAKIDKNPALFNAFYTTILATTLKPMSILALGVNTKGGKEDAKYASAKSISTGILDFLISLIIFIPMNKKLDKVGRKLYNINKSIYFQNKEMCSNYKSIMNRFIKIGTLPIFSFLKFGAIQPTVDLIFKNDKNSNK